jgi:hypothetical protein
MPSLNKKRNCSRLDLPEHWNTAPIPISLKDPPRKARPRKIYCALLCHPYKRLFKKDTYVTVTYDPLISLVKHNSRDLGNKETRIVAPFWQLHVVAGPFALLSGAMSYAQFLVDITRSAPSKRKRAQELAEAFNVKCYTHTAEPPGGMDDYIQKNTPPEVHQTYQRAVIIRKAANEATKRRLESSKVSKK